MLPCTPVIDPSQRPSDQVAGASAYRQNDPVWVWVSVLGDGQWRPGVVNASSDLAVLATFLIGPGGGTAVDSLLPRHVMARTEHDADLDGPVAEPPLPRRPRTIRAAPTDARPWRDRPRLHCPGA